MPRPDLTLEQPLGRYTSQDHETWQRLFVRQTGLLQGRVSSVFQHGVEALELTAERVPDFAELNRRIAPLTGWSLVAVAGALPDEIFFEHLANRRFPAPWWIRPPEQIDHVGEPDVFHAIFGHAPHLTHPAFADFLQAFGIGAMKARQYDALPCIARLYWYTVRFGLVNSAYGLRIYGSGILSSPSETLNALDSRLPHRIGFDLKRVMRTRYRSESVLPTYFVINSFRQLYLATRPDFAPLYVALKGLPSLPAGAVLPNDVVLHFGAGVGNADAVEL